jgi:hypothetical protein
MYLPTWNLLSTGIAPASSSGIAIERVVGVLQETRIKFTKVNGRTKCILPPKEKKNYFPIN